MTAFLAAIIPVLLKLVLGALSYFDKQTLINLGSDKAIRATLAEIIRKVGIAHDVDAEIDGLSDDAVFDRLSKYAKPDRAGQLLPGGGDDNVSTVRAKRPEGGP